MTGKVYLVGAGPGDPGLITVKGMQALERAQVVVYDRLVDPVLLDVVPSSAERVFVGKSRGNQELTQDGINQVLVDRASKGMTVVRLKGGDPFVFGRGGEEALELRKHGLSFEIVPGVTSAIAGPAYAGIPLTHRGVATTFTVVSGSEDPSKPESSVPWEALARNGGTLVVLMGWASLEKIIDTLQREGLPSHTPAALVQWGTWSAQRTVTGTLENILQRGRDTGLNPPVIAVIGQVVNLREELGWFDRRVLFGKRVLITRSRSQASRLRTLLEEAGAQAVELPTIEIGELDDYAQLDGTLTRIGEYQWVIFASANAVEAVFGRLAAQGKDARALGQVTVGAIGPATAQALASRGIKADFVPTRPVSEAVLAELSGREWQGMRVLLPAADIGRDELDKGLSRLGAKVDRIAAYKNVPVADVSQRAKDAFAGGVDVVTFTSSSTVRNLVESLNGDRAALDASFIACIGPVTSATARELGLRVDLEATEHTVDGLVAALANHFSV
ncbi:MAG: uroporphyrinogen-III C-methyltransferase [SAR202 cluster bacterium Io17-Chloro-G9]|nr:MAG: uroporphyrinogen-III C-methyltransferase [SAR202 cluster bacterium Io17-Chloro-G9]